MNKYTLRQLEYLVACVDNRSIAKAAKLMNVSQPTISVAISKLEAQFGVQLLLRHHSQGVSATPSANNILTSTRSLLAQAEGPAATSAANWHSDCGRPAAWQLQHLGTAYSAQADTHLYPDLPRRSHPHSRGDRGATAQKSL